MFFHPSADLPRVANSQRAAGGVEDWRAQADKWSDDSIRRTALDLLENPVGRRFLESLFANSPYLTRCAMSDIGFTVRLLEAGPERALTGILNEMKDESSRERNRDTLMRDLRKAKRETALLVAAADITGYWGLVRLTGALTDFADGAISAVVSHLLLGMADRGDLNVPDVDFPEDDCGYVVLAMGKHGARELNYSSDIDLIVLYDPIKLDYRGNGAEQQAMVRMTRDLVTILSERTGDGYVARVDLRLRPDPSATPIAVPYAGILSYYLRRGRDWERAAMIKARPVAGDLSLGRQFLSALNPFIWRDERDFWTLRAIQSIKQQINKQRGGNEIGFAGQNVKLGYGGIREVEFFAQTLQLIFGGRDPYVRCIKTVDALAALSEADWVELEVAEDLIHGYEFLRTVEHRLQMVNDQQTQTLPTDKAALEDIAAFMGYDETEAFRDDLQTQLHKVDAHYSDVFDKTPEAVELSDDLLGDQVGQAEERLSAAGFLDSPSALELVRGWIAPAHRAANDRRGPGLVRRLVPALLENIAKGPAPDDALRRFNRFLSAVDDPIKLLSLLTARPALVELAADLAGSAPALIDELATMPELLESALEAGFMTDVPEPRLLRADCAVTLGEAFDLDGIAGNLGRWIKENRFPIVTGLSRQEMNAREAGQSLSEIYEAAIWGLVARVMEICRADDTAVPDVTLAVVALGRLADRNLTARSALDLAFVLDDSPDPEQADDRQRSAQAERANVVARQIIGCLGHESGAGGVSVGSTSGIGSIADGNLVLPLSALKRRVSELDREPLIEFAGARVVAGEAGLAERIESLLPSLAGVGLERSEINRRFGIARNRLLDGVTDADAWDLEGRQGGLSEFHLVIDYFRITEEIARARTCGQPGVQAVESLSDAGLLDSSLARDLVHAGRLINGLQHFLHAALGPVEARIDLGDAQHDAIARVAGQTNFEDVERTLAQSCDIIDKVVTDAIGALA